MESGRLKRERSVREIGEERTAVATDIRRQFSVWSTFSIFFHIDRVQRKMRQEETGRTEKKTAEGQFNVKILNAIAFVFRF